MSEITEFFRAGCEGCIEVRHHCFICRHPIREEVVNKIKVKCPCMVCLVKGICSQVCKDRIAWSDEMFSVK